MVYVRESLIEKYLVDEVKKRGGISYKLSPIGRANKPDRLVLLPNGRMVMVECKSPGQKPRIGQLREHELLRAIGYKVVVMDSKDVGFLDEDV